MNLLYLFFALALAACSTTYQLPEITNADVAAARSQFASAGANPTTSGISEARYWQVARKVEPVAEQFCRAQIQRNTTCDVQVRLDRDRSKPANAYHYYDRGVPVVEFNINMLDKITNDDQVAFIFGHEMGHHMADHINKTQQQAVTSAIIVGAISGAIAIGADASPGEVVLATEIGSLAGAAAGQLTFSQTYELEADVIGTYIAEMAGYDAAKGASIFAQREPGQNSAGTKSLWGTHPPNETRIAQVSATIREIRQRGQVPVLSFAPVAR